MTELTTTDRLGDIKFGLPEDIAPHIKPWAYYEILGVPRDASPEAIKAAKKKLSFEYHPDRAQHLGADAEALAAERQKRVLEIADVLLDDGGELEPLWSRRRLYDETSRYGEYFGAVHIDHKGKRTVTVAEELLTILELEKIVTKAKHDFKKELPEVADLITQVEAAAKRGDHYTAQQYHRKIAEQLAEREGVSVDEFMRRQKEMYEAHQKILREHQVKTSRFQTKLADELKAEKAKGVAAPQSRDEPHKVFDIWYNGEENGFSTVTFGNTNYPYCYVMGFEETETMVRMGIKGSTTLSGMRKVHFKAQHASVRITDAYLEGIFQIVNGRVTIEYEGSSYGAVLRVRAPTVTPSEDFVREGDLYVPKAFAVEGWKDRTPAVDIAVFNGAVDMKLKRPEVQAVKGGYSNDFGKYLFSKDSQITPIGFEDILRGNNYRKY